MKTQKNFLMEKLFELRYKDTNELIIASISETAVRKEWLRMKEDGEDMTNVIGTENFIRTKEWNEIMTQA
jgi:hypothetical protein